jgi:hypothetical protein
MSNESSKNPSAYSGLETALLLADEIQKEIFKAAFNALSEERRLELEARNIFLVYEKKENEGAITYSFADNTDIIVVPNSTGIIAAKARIPTCPIVEVMGVGYLTLAHDLLETYPEDGRFGYSRLLAIARDISPENKLSPNRYVNGDQILHAFVTKPVAHDLVGKFLIRGASEQNAYTEMPGQTKIVHSSQAPSQEVHSFSRGLLQPLR